MTRKIYKAYCTELPFVDVPPIAKEYPRAPTTSDTEFSIGYPWVYKPTADSANLYQFGGINSTGGAIWVLTGPGSSDVDTLTGDTGTATPVGGNIQIAGGSYITTSAAGNVVTINSSSGGAPVSKYIVDAAGDADYTTIQAAVTAANAAGGGIVYIRPAAYTENLTLYDNIELVGAVGEVDAGNITITGTHTPPTSGSFAARNIEFISATHVFNSASAGTALISLNECVFNITNGYILNLINWTGEFRFNNCSSTGTNDGIINNTGSATVFTNNSQLGAGTGNTFTANGTLRFDLTYIVCPANLTGSGTNRGLLAIFGNTVTLGGSATWTFDNASRFEGTLTTANSASFSIYNTTFSTGATPALTHGSSGTILLTNNGITTSNNPAIDGTGAGTLTIGSCTFTDNANLAGTLTVAYDQTTTGRLYATGAHFIDSGTGNDITLQMGDNAAANKISFTDSGSVEISSLDSNGTLTVANMDGIIGATTPAAGTFTTVTGNTSVSTPLYTVGAGTDLQVTAAVGQDIIFQMGDAAGANKVSFQSSTPAEVFAVDSTGVMTLAGLTVTGAFAQTGGTFNVGQDNAANAINIGGGTTARAIGIGNSAAAHVLTLGSNNAAAQTIIQSGTAGLTLDSTGVLELNSSAAAIGIGNDADAFAINIGTGAAARTVTIGNATGASSVVVDCGTGNADFGVSATVHTTRVGSTTGAADTTVQAGTGALTINGGGAIDMDAAGQLQINSSASTIDIGNDAVAQNMNIGTGAAARVLTIGNVTGATQVDVNTGTGGFNVATTGTGDIILNSDDTVLIDADGVLELNSSAGAISIGNDADAQNINVGTGAAARTLTFGNVTGATAVNVNSGTGACAWTTTNGAFSLITGSGAVNLAADAAAKDVTLGNTTGASSLTLQAGTGEITVTGTVKQIDGELIGQTGIYIPAFTQDTVAASAANTGGVPTGATGNVNVYSMQTGAVMQGFVVGAGQTILQPIMGANGLIISADQAAAEGMEYNFPYHQYTIGTSDPFAFELGLYINDMDAADPFVFGFRKTEANNALMANYNTYATIGMNAATSVVNIVILDELNAAGQTATNTNDAWGGDGSYHVLRVLVDGTGNVTYTIDGVAPTATHALQFDNADVVIPFIRIKHAAGAQTDVAIRRMRIGYQA